MFSLDAVALTPGKMAVRKQVRFHSADADRISAAAAAMGMTVADFIRQAALLRPQDIEQRLTTSNLSDEAFEAFNVIVTAEGRQVPALVNALRQTRYALKTGR